MRTKKVNRYWCDFCNKAGLSADAMAKHEAHCTMNPDRNCRVCTLINGGYTVGRERMAELVALLPDSTAYNTGDGIYFGNDNDDGNEAYKLARAVAAVLPKLREEVEDCPACILAALRQAKIPVPMVEGFDFKAEMRGVFDGCNANRDEGHY